MNNELEGLESVSIEDIDTFVDYKKLPMNKLQEEIVDILCDRTGTQDRNFFRVMVAYKFCETASMMRANINTDFVKNLPTNMYALNLAPSGYSKNASMNILDKELFKEFKSKFSVELFQDQVDTNLAKLAADMELSTGMDVADCYKTLQKEYSSFPKFLYSFGSSTPEGLKAQRVKLSMAGIGCTSNVIDEIGSNLTNNKESFTVMLEAYDMGDNKQKLIKTDGGNGDLRSSVPSCLFAFGTQSKLLDGSQVEKQFFELLEEGYGRRFIIGYVPSNTKRKKMTGKEMFDMISNPMVDLKLKSISKDIEKLADKSLIDISLNMDEATQVKLLEYRLHCDEIADNLKEHEEILKAVIKHSYWRALKVSGAYAFMEGVSTITEEHLDNAIALCEEGIDSFKTLLKREKPYERLAKYISNVEKKVTQVDLIEDLVFYRGSESHRKELMSLAIAYGYNNNIIIKKTIKEGVEFLEGETLKETDLNQIKCSWSKDITEGYKSAVSSFDKLYQLVDANGFHYCSHSFKDGYRKSENAIEGFNLLILDIDSGLSIETCKTLLNDYTYLISTTKRHTEKKNRFRIILPMSHELKLNADDYKRFMANVYSWLPFEGDEQTKDIARKWQSHKGEHFYNEGKLIDVLPFIPDTSKEENRRNQTHKYEDTEALQRWFLMNFDQDAGRNNTLIKYALALLDSGMNSDNIRHSLYDLNSKLDEPLKESELESTIMKTVIRKEALMEQEIN